MSVRLPVLALTLAACTRATVITPERDPAELVFGDPAWRIPGTIEHIAFARAAIEATTVDGARFAFDRDGARRPLPAVPEAQRDGLRRGVDGARVVSGGELGTTLLVVSGGGAPVTLEQSRHYDSPRFSGDWVIAARSQRNVAIWDAATGKRLRVFGLGNTDAFALSPDRALLAIGTFHDGKGWVIDVYRVEDGERTTSVRFACNPSQLAITPQSDALAIACEDEVRVVKLPGGEPVAELPGDRDYPRTLAWSPTGDALALGTNDSVLYLWRASDWQQVSRVQGARGTVRQLAVAGDLLVSRGASSAWLWSTETARPILELGGTGRDVYAIATDGDETLVASETRGANQTVIERWRGAARRDRKAIPSRFGLGALVRDLGPVAGGVWYTAGGQLYVLDRDLKPAWATEPMTTDELAIADADAVATPDGHRVAMYGSDTLTIADAIERRVVARAALACGGELAISPDGARVAMFDTRGITVLDADTARVVASLALRSTARDPHSLAWSGRDVIAAAVGGKLVAWTPGAPRADAMAAPGITSLAISADHAYLGRSDGTVVRRSLTALRKTATPLAARPVAPCDAHDSEGVLMGGFLGMFGDAARGRLPDDGHYDDDDPP